MKFLDHVKGIKCSKLPRTGWCEVSQIWGPQWDSEGLTLEVAVKCWVICIAKCLSVPRFSSFFIHLMMFAILVYVFGAVINHIFVKVNLLHSWWFGIVLHRVTHLWKVSNESVLLEVVFEHQMSGWGGVRRVLWNCEPCDGSLYLPCDFHKSRAHVMLCLDWEVIWWGMIVHNDVDVSLDDCQLPEG